MNFDDWIGKNQIKIHQSISSFYLKKYYNLIKQRIISSEKNVKIQVIITIIIMLTRSSERDFNPIRYTGLFLPRFENYTGYL